MAGTSPGQEQSLAGRTGEGASAQPVQQRSLELLEFAKVRERLARHASQPLAAELALDLAPSFLESAVRQLQKETGEAVALLREVPSLDLSGASDVRPQVRRAAKGGVLAGEELLAIQRTLEAIRRTRAPVLRMKGRAPGLRDLARNIPDLRALQDRVQGALDGAGNVVDDASPYLRLLRQDARDRYQQLMQALTDFAHSPTGREALQDDFITVRSQRLVVPVKSEMRSMVPGVVHGVSDSGATLFIEPFSIVDRGNAWREVVAAEEQEVQRILRSLSAEVGARSQDIEAGLELAARLDLALAKARYAQATGSAAPVTLESGQPQLRLVEARHPLLTGDVVPISLHVGPGWSSLVITGPNTGGKTVALKTVGLLALMHQAGLWLPAGDGTSLPVFDGVYADIGDRQSIEASVSTFSSHVSSIVDILGVATERSLVLLDELGTSTDPEEGSALARAILAHLTHRRVPAVVTTHHRTVAAFAEQQEGMENASVELDPATLRPTYRVTMGLPGRSYALAVAEHLRLEQSILQKARQLLDPGHAETEELLVELQRERRLTVQKLQQAEEAENKARSLQRDVEGQWAELHRQREELMDRTRRQLQARARQVLKLLHQAERAASVRPRAMSAQGAAQARPLVEEALQQLRRKAWSPPPEREQRGALRVGDVVEIGELRFTGQVASLPDDDGLVDVLVGNARVTLDASRLRKAGTLSGKEAAAPATSIHLDPSRALIGPEPELDLRGTRAAQALERLDAFLDQALAQGRSRVRVVHGRGTGALRQAVWRHLASHPIARSYGSAEPERGGDGATIVELA